MGVLTISTFEVANIRFGNVKTGKAFSNVEVGCCKDSKEKLYLQTPQMRVPFPARAFDDKYNFCIAFDLLPELEDTESIEIFLTKMRALESAILTEAVEKSADWFGEKKSLEQVTAMFKPCVSNPSQVYAPYMTLKLGYPYKDPVTTTNFYDEDGEDTPDPNPEELIVRGTFARCIVLCKGIWIRGGIQFGVTWQVEQLQVHTPPPPSSTALTSSTVTKIQSNTGLKVAAANAISAECDFSD